MRFDRVVLGEVRGAELTDLLSALNTGHEGGCGTVHANSVADVPARLEAAGPDGAAGTPFTARLTSLDGRRVATGRDFTDAGVLRPAAVKAAVVHLREAGARAVADAVMRSAAISRPPSTS